ncbi:serine hydrolase [Microbulbifer sp. SA54]|uniref:serine hydrolase n=1 Tax=Microbulbifer sp. SA54 TaxID=3401577 RepID=UPI003AAAAE16
MSRTLLTYDDLIPGIGSGAPVNLSAYALPEGAAHPVHVFAGTLALSGEKTAGKFAEIKDLYGYTGGDDHPRKHLPPFEFQFLQAGSYIFPLRRESIAGNHPDWEYVLTPGRVWQEQGDLGYSRVALPFALQERNANCMHNGVLSFLFKADGSISRAAYQISSETCLYFKADWWGILEASYTPQIIPDQKALIQRYQRELDARMPVKPLSALAVDYPGADYAVFANPSGNDSPEVTLAGFVVDGTHYRGDCATRHGDYPYCDSLVLPSYSTAKGLFAGLAMMRLQQLYPGVRDAEVSRYIDACSDHRWHDVTLNDLLDMTTGNYHSDAYMEDEDSPHTEGLFFAEKHQQKIQYSCDYYTRKSPPGSQWVYHTSDTYIAGTLMAEYLRALGGDEVDLFTDIVVSDLWDPIGISATGRYTRRTYDSRRQPFSGWGLMWLPDDVAKIARFVALDEGRVDGQAKLNVDELDAALQRRSADKGAEPLAAYRYNNGFWAYDVGGQLEGCSGELWIPFLSGYGGITIALLPNQSIYYYFSDRGDFGWLHAVRAAHSIRRLCP